MNMNIDRKAVERLHEVASHASMSEDEKMDIFLHEPGVADLITEMTRATNVSILNMMAVIMSAKNTNTFFRGKCAFLLTPATIKMVSDVLNHTGRMDSEDDVFQSTIAMLGDGFITISKTNLKDDNGDEIFSLRCTPKVLKKYRHMLDR